MKKSKISKAALAPNINLSSAKTLLSQWLLQSLGSKTVDVGVLMHETLDYLLSNADAKTKKSIVLDIQRAEELLHQR